MAKTARTTISIPADLKARMDAIEEPVNWSAVASRAFEQEVARHIQKRGAKTMEDVVNRLRASKRKSGGAAHDRGVQAGGAWAKSEAEADELARLEEFRDSCERDGYTFEDWFRLDHDAPLDSAGWIAVAILGMDDDNHDSDLARVTADGLFGETRKDRDPEYLRGFVDGALDVWSEVKDRI